MPNYVYRCQWCKKEIEVFHTMKEVDEPSEELLEKISCPLKEDCVEKNLKHCAKDEDLVFKRIPQMPQIMGMVNGSSLKGKERAQTIQKERKQRSHEHFKKEIYPTLPKAEKKFFDKKQNKDGRVK